MAKPIKSLDEIILLEPGKQTEFRKINNTGDLVREFQRCLGGGDLCEEIGIYTLEDAENEKEKLHSIIFWDGLENQADIDPESVAKLWPLFHQGDGHYFFYDPVDKTFIALYHDPDILEVVGESLPEAINVALDTNFNFVPEDFSPVYWKPRYPFTMRFQGYGTLTPAKLFESILANPAPSHRYAGATRGDLIWADQHSHLHYVLREGSDLPPSVDARFYSPRKTLETAKIEEALRLAANSNNLNIG
jgi:hypothetical protein